MTNDNNNERENKMTFSKFDTAVSSEETQAYSDYVDAAELAAIEAEEENWEELESDDGHRELYDDEFFEVSFDDALALEVAHDEMRDMDFYGYDE